MLLGGLAVLVAVLLGAWGILHTITASSPVNGAATMSATPTGSARPTPSTAPSPLPLPPSAPVPDKVVAASAPLRLRVPAIGIDGAVSEYTQKMIDARGGFDPVTLQTIAWDTTISGGLAGTDAVNTVYLYGHSWVDPAVFNGLKDLPPGAVAAVDTARGTLCYVVQKTLELNKAAYKSNDELTRIIPNRLVLVSCYRPVGYDPGSATVQNIVVVLQLDRHATTAGC
jgi:hypothetical protein